MDADIRIFINGIREKTGIDFAVYDSEGTLIAGEKYATNPIPVNFEGIVSDEKNQITLFNIKYKSKGFIGCLKGAGKTQSNYAFLIGELAENSYFKDKYK